MSTKSLLFMIVSVLILVVSAVFAQTCPTPWYQCTGTPEATDVWIDDDASAAFSMAGGTVVSNFTFADSPSSILYLLGDPQAVTLTFDPPLMFDTYNALTLWAYGSTDELNAISVDLLVSSSDSSRCGGSKKLGQFTSPTRSPDPQWVKVYIPWHSFGVDRDRNITSLVLGTMPGTDQTDHEVYFDNFRLIWEILFDVPLLLQVSFVFVCSFTYLQIMCYSFFESAVLLTWPSLYLRISESHTDAVFPIDYARYEFTDADGLSFRPTVDSNVTGLVPSEMDRSVAAHFRPGAASLSPRPQELIESDAVSALLVVNFNTFIKQSDFVLRSSYGALQHAFFLQMRDIASATPSMNSQLNMAGGQSSVISTTATGVGPLATGATYFIMFTWSKSAQTHCFYINDYSNCTTAAKLGQDLDNWFSNSASGGRIEFMSTSSGDAIGSNFALWTSALSAGQVAQLRAAFLVAPTFPPPTTTPAPTTTTPAPTTTTPAPTTTTPLPTTTTPMPTTTTPEPTTITPTPTTATTTAAPTTVTSTPTATSTPSQTQTNAPSTSTAAATKRKKKSKTVLIIVIVIVIVAILLIAALIAAGLVYWFKIRRAPVKNADQDMHYVLLERFGDVLTNDDN